MEARQTTSVFSYKPWVSQLSTRLIESHFSANCLSLFPFRDWSGLGQRHISSCNHFCLWLMLVVTMFLSLSLSFQDVMCLVGKCDACIKKGHSHAWVPALERHLNCCQGTCLFKTETCVFFCISFVVVLYFFITHSDEQCHVGLYPGVCFFICLRVSILQWDICIMKVMEIGRIVQKCFYIYIYMCNLCVIAVFVDTYLKIFLTYCLDCYQTQSPWHTNLSSSRTSTILDESKS